MDKDIFIMDNKKKNNHIKVTSSFLIDNPTKEDIQKLQREVQHILSTCIGIQLNEMKSLEWHEKKIV